MKRTKSELEADYQNLLERYEELRKTAKLLSDPQSISILSTAQGYSVDNLAQSISTLKTSVNTTLNELTDKLISEAQKFSELQKAIELTKKNLDLHYHIQVGAETLDYLINEYKIKKVSFEEEIVAKKRDWTREQEERDYITKLRARRSQEEFEEAKIKQNNILKEREEQVTLQEQNVSELRNQVESFPVELNKALLQREQEVAKRLNADFDGKLSNIKKDWEGQKHIYEIKTDTLEEKLKRQDTENAALRQELETANNRVQELAIKIIEGGSKVVKSEEGKDNKV